MQSHIDLVDKVKKIFRGTVIQGKHCVVFDIDDTLIQSRTGRVIYYIKKLYDFFINNGVKIFLLTARDPYYRENTITQLRRLEITGYKDLFMVGSKDRGRMKMSMRKMIENDRGYTILFNVGDADSDFSGGYFDVKVKVPILY